MSVSDLKTSSRQRFLPYLVAFITVGFAIIGTLRLGSGINHISTIFFCSIIVSSWYGGLLPGLFAALLSWLALDYYFISPIYSFAVSSARVPEMIVFGATAPLISWLNSGPRWVKWSLRQAEETKPALRGIVVKFSLAVVASLAACLSAAVTALFRLGGGLAALWITVGLASCCSALFLIILACGELR
jgi:K+-sensing histidine kinase KdpD